MSSGSREPPKFKKGGEAASSNYTYNKRNLGGPVKKAVPRFMSKKEKEAKEAADKKQKAYREKAKRMKELEKEIEEMQMLVFRKIRDPNLKRRHSLTSYRETLPAHEQKRKEIPSCYHDDVSFNEY
jgi:hypothetical protein